VVKVVGWTFTQDAYRHGRDEWLRQVVEALGEADEVLIFDHQSEDGSDELVRELGGVLWKHDDRNRTIGRAMNLGHQAAADAAGPDGLVVTAQDDIVWRPGWRERLQGFWEEAPNSIGLVSGLLEPNFPWAAPIDRVEHGGLAGLSRLTVPGGAWTYRGRMWQAMRWANEVQPSHDMPICNRVRDAGMSLVAVDLADHLGAVRSTWGNNSYIGSARLDLQRWGLR
jgi:glycosyltransferase involved in cell wall biosynthesis